MLSKSKRLVLILMGVLLINDICRIIKVLMNTGSDYKMFNFFFSTISDKIIVHFSIIYIMIVLVAYFCMNFFKHKG